MSSADLGRATMNWVLFSISLASNFVLLQASSAGLLGLDAPLGFMLRTRILSGFAPSSFVLRTCILNRLTPSGFALCARILSFFAPSSFMLTKIFGKNKCVSIDSKCSETHRHARKICINV